MAIPTTGEEVNGLLAPEACTYDGIAVFVAVPWALASVVVDVGGEVANPPIEYMAIATPPVLAVVLIPVVLIPVLILMPLDVA